MGVTFVYVHLAGGNPAQIHKDNTEEEICFFSKSIVTETLNCKKEYFKKIKINNWSLMVPYSLAYALFFNCTKQSPYFCSA